MSVSASILAVCKDGAHRFSKQPCQSIELEAGFGVVGDAHAGEKVQHLSRVRTDPTQPNLRQVHLIHAELFDEMRDFGFALSPGDLGENLTTTGIDLLSLGRDTILAIGDEVHLRVTGLRNPCSQIEAFMPGLLGKLALKTANGIERKAGIMSVVERGGTIRPGDGIAAFAPEGPHIALDRV